MINLSRYDSALYAVQQDAFQIIARDERFRFAEIVRDGFQTPIKQ